MKASFSFNRSSSSSSSSLSLSSTDSIGAVGDRMRAEEEEEGLSDDRADAATAIWSAIDLVPSTPSSPSSSSSSSSEVKTLIAASSLVSCMTSCRISMTSANCFMSRVPVPVPSSATAPTSSMASSTSFLLIDPSSNMSRIESHW